MPALDGVEKLYSTSSRGRNKYASLGVKGVCVGLIQNLIHLIGAAAQRDSADRTAL